MDRRPARLLLVLAAIGVAAPGAAEPLSIRSNFTIGSEGGIQCAVQARANDPGASGTFDRAYAVTCRDAAAPVGRLYVLRATADAAARLERLREPRVACEPARSTADGSVQECRTRDTGADYRVYTRRQGRNVHIAEGLTGYDDALRLGLQSLLADKVMAGTITAASTAATDRAAFARAQAASLDARAALSEAYRRNNGGAYAESAEFFDVVALARTAGVSTAEALLGAALQQSNLGAYAVADSLLRRISAADLADPVIGRVARNVRAIQFLNQTAPRRALAELDRPLPPLAVKAGSGGAVIDEATATVLNRKARLAKDSDRLTPEERVQILDAQALQLRGSALRLVDDRAAARAAFAQAQAALSRAATERAVSISRLESATLAEMGRLLESEGDLVAAVDYQRRALAAITAEFPGSYAALASQARLASVLARKGDTEAALALYRGVVAGAVAAGGSTPGIGANLGAYFDLLQQQAASQPGLAADFFAAAQLLVRPGVAQTQAVLARELSGGSDEAARQFRQSVNLTREVERARVELLRLQAVDPPTGEITARITELDARLATLAAQQAATTAQLAKYPRYRALSGSTLSLADLQKTLRPGEAYLKLTIFGQRGWGLLATRDIARVYPLSASPAELADQVRALRESIVQVQDGQTLTPPFDVRLARTLFVEVLGPVADRLAGVTHLIFEPDGPLLKLPLNLLVTDDASVAAYQARQQAADADPFDMRGVAWLGRQLEVSTAVSALAFRDLRAAPPSTARKPYLGFGENALPTPAQAARAAATGGLIGAGADGCGWPLAQWTLPISARELRLADQILGGDPADVVTQAAFTDRAITGRQDLADYRILHFATHGLVTAPRAGCPARPALLTSFADDTADGLLTFSEIYDLRLNADLVVLSACDTAGEASADVTREAGLSGGGDFALDGLVRAFVGAGGRTIVASHWPVPDDYGATGKLISGLFTTKPGDGVGAALVAGQRQLMDAAETSHPFYWAAFAVIGDGTRAVVPK